MATVFEIASQAAELRVKVADKMSVSLTKFAILREAQKGARSIGMIADAAGMSRPAVTIATDKLEIEGLIRKFRPARGEGDRRTVMISLTEQGKQLLDALRAEKVE